MQTIAERVAEMKATGVFYLRHPLPFFPGKPATTEEAQLQDTRMEQDARRQLVEELSR